MNEQEQAVAAALQKYAEGLNRADMATILDLYTPDGVFMPQNSPSSIGINAVRAAYQAVFNAITLTVDFKIAEVHLLAPDWAFARTNSAGTVKVHATGESSAEANQELFVMQKLDDSWKIARYCFSTTNPPRA